MYCNFLDVAIAVAVVILWCSFAGISMSTWIPIKTDGIQ